MSAAYERREIDLYLAHLLARVLNLVSGNFNGLGLPKRQLERVRTNLEAVAAIADASELVLINARLRDEIRASIRYQVLCEQSGLQQDPWADREYLEKFRGKAVRPRNTKKLRAEVEALYGPTLASRGAP